MTKFRQRRWRAIVAALAGAALILQAALASFAPLAAADPVDEFAAHALCFGSADGRTDQDAPPPATDRARQACCILCVVPGLAAPGGPAAIAAAALEVRLAAPLQAPAAAHLAAPPELSPIRPRAPPEA